MDWMTNTTALTATQKRKGAELLCLSVEQPLLRLGAAYHIAHIETSRQVQYATLTSTPLLA